MTDPLPPTDLGEIVVTGQRRSSPATSFPVGGGGGSPDEQLEIGEDPDSGGGERPNPQCTDPEARRIWNADASAATAGREFLDRAATLGDNPPLGIREFGAALILQPDDSVTLGPVEWGQPGVPGQVPGVIIDTTGVTNQNWMGDVHSHPSGNGLPSQTDINGFLDNLALAEQAGRNTDNISMYIIVEDNNTTPPSRRIYAYNKNSDMNALGDEVNPDAIPCP